MNEMKILRLKSALLIAKYEADRYSEIEDGGTSNFDTPVLKLPSEWTQQSLDAAFMNTGLGYSRIAKETFEIFGAVEGQGYRRTAMAKAFRDAMENLGYVAYVHYIID